jgi:hypothetical protein
MLYTLCSLHAIAAVYMLSTLCPCCRATMQTLLNANITDLSTLRFGDAKTLPSPDVHLRDGFQAVVRTPPWGSLSFSDACRPLKLQGSRSPCYQDAQHVSKLQRC